MSFPRRLSFVLAALAATAVVVVAAPVATAAKGSPAPLTGRGWYGLPTTMMISTPQVFVGVPVTFTATLSNTIVDGTVTFWVNDPIYGLAPSVPVVNGKATLTWMPGYTWIKNWQLYGASFMPNPQQGTTMAAASTPYMSVLPNRGSDPIVFGPVSSSLVPGSTLALTASTASGSAVALSISGPCSLSNLGTNSVTVTTGAAGSCVVTAVSNGGNGYVGATSSHTISVSPSDQGKKPTKRPTKKK